MQGECLSLVYSRAGGCLNEGGDGNLGNFTAHTTAATILPAADKFHSGQSIEISLSAKRNTLTGERESGWTSVARAGPCSTAQLQW